jgi:hypothetical protein
VVILRRRWDIRLLRESVFWAWVAVRAVAAGEEAQAWTSLGQTDWCRRKIRSQSLRGFALVERGYWLWFGRSKGRGGEDAGVAAESQMEEGVEDVFLQYWNYHDNSLFCSDYSHWRYHVHHGSVLDP